MGNVLYEFLPGRSITPYVGAGVGVDFMDGVSEFLPIRSSPVRASWMPGGTSMTPHRVEILIR
jgi:hypothetical protein